MTNKIAVGAYMRGNVPYANIANERSLKPFERITQRCIYFVAKSMMRAAHIETI